MLVLQTGAQGKSRELFALDMGEKLYEEVFFGHEAVTPTAHPKVLRSPADPVSPATAGRRRRASAGGDVG